MIYINKNSTNTEYVTAVELTTIRPLSAITYLWSLKSKETNTEKQFIPLNPSFDKFIITENDSENLTGGTVSLKAGQYSYSIYEQASNTNLDLSFTGCLLETGLLYVSGSSQFNYTSDPNSKFSYTI